MQVFVDRTVKIWLSIDILFKLTKLSKEFYSSIKFMHDVSNEVRIFFCNTTMKRKLLKNINNINIRILIIIGR